MILKNYVFISMLMALTATITVGKPMNNKNSSTLQVSSQSFTNGQPIPTKYGYKNQNISPQLSWSNASTGTKSFVVICQDPDAPKPNTPWVHWIIFNIPASITFLPEGFTANNGIQEGKNSWGQIGWGGPNPPSGIHRYFFKIYALDAMLSNLTSPNKDELLAAINKVKIMGQGEIMGTYQALK